MSFKEIKGQDRPIQILQGYIEQGRLEGGHLFLGPEGVGKKLIAQTLAKAVNCEDESFDTSHSSLGFARDSLRSLSVNGERSRTID